MADMEWLTLDATSNVSRSLASVVPQGASAIQVAQEKLAQEKLLIRGSAQASIGSAQARKDGEFAVVQGELRRFCFFCGKLCRFVFCLFTEWGYINRCCFLSDRSFGCFC